jgi:hypothetical protein
MTFILWGFYILGGLGSMWKRANLSASSAHTPWDNVRGYAGEHGPQLMINFLLSTALFLTVWQDTSFLTHALLFVGVSKDVEVPLNPFTAALYGVFSDQVMDFIVAKLIGRFGPK